MAALSETELYKYPKNSPKDRVPIFLDKLLNEKPFELVNGQKTKLKFQASLYEAIEKRKPLKGFVLLDSKGKTLKFSDLKKSKEFGGGGGTGAGAENTALNESAQALYAAAKWKGSKDYSETDLKSVSSSIDISENVNDIIKKLPSDWVKSSIIGAEKLYTEFKGKSYTFHRGSNWVKKLETHFKKLNGLSGKYFSNTNKWTPADIWLVSDTGKRIDLTESKSLTELNSMLKEALQTKDIIGVSLKKVEKEAKMSYVNFGKKYPAVKYDGYIVSKKNFWGAKDVYINYTVKGEMQMRTFSAGASGWQGEIKGEKASHGKISYGVFDRILKQLKTKNTLPASQDLYRKFQSADNKTLTNFWELYKKYDEKDRPKLKFEEFIDEYNKKGADKIFWGYSKYLGLSIIDIITTEKIQDEFVAKAVEYATSMSDLSAPFVKLSDISE